jgi:ribosomal protein S18 acetylase RimI-like enzyme
MSEAQFASFSLLTVEDYAQGRVLSGDWAIDDAKNKAHSLLSKILPDRKKTDGHYFHILFDTELEKNIGELWFAVNALEETAFIYAINIYPQFRRMGYAKHTIQHLEGVAPELGFTKIHLNVFSHNRPAQALYSKLGFLPKSIEMAKSL